MGTTDQKRLEELCRMGSPSACTFAKMEPPSAEKEAELARNRDADDAANREALAARLESAGVNKQIAESVRMGRDVVYAKDIEEAERTVRENFPDMADEILDDFYKFRTPWYKRTKTWVIAGAIAATTLIVIALKA
jgi:hypothetical protein